MIIELRIGSQSIQVDKELLSKYSDYFEAMFSTPFSEQSLVTTANSLSLPVITLRNMNFKSVRIIIDYMYSGKLGLTPHNIEDIYLTADFLQISTIRQRCLELFGKKLAPCNCINIYKLSVEHALKRTEEEAVSVMMKCFEQICEDTEYLEFSCLLLARLLNDCQLNIALEMTLFRVIEKWIAYDSVNRKIFKDELLSCLMVELLSKQEFRKVLNSDLVKRSSALKQRLKQQVGRLPGVGRERVGMIDKRVYIIGGLANTAGYPAVEVYAPYDPRLPSDCTAFLRGPFIHCSVLDSQVEDGTAESSAMVHSTAESSATARSTPASSAMARSTPASSAITARYGGGATVVDNAVFLVGGRTNGGICEKAYKVELHSQRYREIGTMPTWCDHVTVTCSDKRVFVVGGYQHSVTGSLSPSSLVQIYDTMLEKWTKGPDLITGRAHAASIGMDSGGGLPSRVLVLGGYGTKKLASVELVTNSVSVQNLPPMLRARHAFCAAMVNGAVIAVGGWNERSVERYDFRNKQWNMLNNFPKHRDCIQGAVCGGVLYVLGGVKRNNNIPTIERYEEKQDTWSTVGHMLLPRLYSAVVVT